MVVPAIPEKPRLLYSAVVERDRFLSRFWLAVFLIVAVAGAYIALGLAGARGLADLRLLEAGRLVAIVLIFLLGVRGLFNLIRGLSLRNETVRFYDQGFTWSRSGDNSTYAWHDLVTYRDSTGGVYLWRWTVFQSGALLLTMNDGVTYKFNGRFGDTRRCAKLIRRYAAYITGIQMGRDLRDGKRVEIGPDLFVYTAGVDTGKVVVSWDALDIRRNRNMLVVRQKVDGKWQAVGRYDVRKLDNVGGFLELASETIQIHQPGRRKAKTTTAQVTEARKSRTNVFN